jgi:hypothetical protein
LGLPFVAAMPVTGPSAGVVTNLWSLPVDDNPINIASITLDPRAGPAALVLVVQGYPLGGLPPAYVYGLQLSADGMSATMLYRYAGRLPQSLAFFDQW